MPRQMSIAVIREVWNKTMKIHPLKLSLTMAWLGMAANAAYG
jgi:hypothetical protein